MAEEEVVDVWFVLTQQCVLSKFNLLSSSVVIQLLCSQFPCGVPIPVIFAIFYAPPVRIFG